MEHPTSSHHQNLPRDVSPPHFQSSHPKCPFDPSESQDQEPADKINIISEETSETPVHAADTPTTYPNPYAPTHAPKSPEKKKDKIINVEEFSIREGKLQQENDKPFNIKKITKHDFLNKSASEINHEEDPELTPSKIPQHLPGSLLSPLVGIRKDVSKLLHKEDQGPYSMKKMKSTMGVGKAFTPVSSSNALKKYQQRSLSPIRRKVGEKVENIQPRHQQNKSSGGEAQLLQFRNKAKEFEQPQIEEKEESFKKEVEERRSQIYKQVEKKIENEKAIYEARESFGKIQEDKKKEHTDKDENKVRIIEELDISDDEEIKKDNSSPTQQFPQYIAIPNKTQEPHKQQNELEKSENSFSKNFEEDTNLNEQENNDFQVKDFEYEKQAIQVEKLLEEAEQRLNTVENVEQQINQDIDEENEEEEMKEEEENNFEEEAVEYNFTIGRIDEGSAILLTREHDIVDVPVILLPPNISPGDVLTFNIKRDFGAEAAREKEIFDIQDQILSDPLFQE